MLKNRYKNLMQTGSKNSYENGSQKVIPATLIYVFCGDEILMIHRSLGKDAGSRKWNGLGGKLDPGESPLQAAQRELKEESGLNLPLERFQSLGSLFFPNFKAHKSEDWLCFVYAADCTESEQNTLPTGVETPEGSLHWVPKSQVPCLALWEGDRHFINQVIHRTPFTATLWYEAQAVKKVEGPFLLR